MPMTLAFSGEVVHEKLFVKVTAKKSVAPFSGHGVDSYSQVAQTN